MQVKFLNKGSLEKKRQSIFNSIKNQTLQNCWNIITYHVRIFILKTYLLTFEAEVVKKKQSFCHNYSAFIIPLSLQPNDVNLRYCKLWIRQKRLNLKYLYYFFFVAEQPFRSREILNFLRVINLIFPTPAEISKREDLSRKLKVSTCGYQRFSNQV